MNTNFLKNINFSIYGESHGKSIGVIIDSIPSGFKIDFLKIEEALKVRNPNTLFNTKRKEDDNLIIESGILDGLTTGTPLMLRLENNKANSKAYHKFDFRMTHADFTSYLKFGDSYPYPGGGPFSGRLTAIIIIVGEIFEQLLNNENINLEIYNQINSLLHVKTKNIKNYELKELKMYKEEMKKNEKEILNNSQKIKYQLPVIDTKKRQEMTTALEMVTKNNDSVGSKVEFRICNIPPKLGELYFDSFESILSHALFSIPGLKGVVFGVEDDYYEKLGSELLEDFQIENNKIKMNTNYSGGINGGITNGVQDIIFSCIIKAPTPLGKTQSLLKIKDGKYFKEENIIKGRHDRLISNKILKIIEAWINIVVYDLYLENKKISKK